MSSAEDLLIIYEAEAEQWAVYLRSIFAGPVPEGGICCYDIATVTSRREDFLRLGQYKVKLLILSRGMLEGLCQLRRFFLARVLNPAAHVVVLLCGVDSLAPLLEVVPLKGDECLQISSEQDADEYMSAVTDIVQRGHQAAAGNVSSVPGKLTGLELNLKLESRQSTGASSTKPNNMLLVPSRVPCGTPGEVFIILKDTVASKDAEVEFSRSKQRVRVKPVHWNKHTLCVNAADFPAGSVGVTLYCCGVVMGKAHLQYYSTMDEMACLLTRVADPVDFMCQSLQVSSVEKLDQRLSSMLLEAMPSTGFQGLQGDYPPEGEAHPEEVPSLLHFAAQNGFKDVSNVLLQCPGAKRALCTANRQGQTPAEIAQHNGHDELHVVLQQTLNMFTVGKDSDDTSVYEMMCTAGNPSAPDTQIEEHGEGEEVGDDEDEEDLYAPLGVNDEDYDTILTSSGAVVIANRPPAPTPRPETTPVKEDSTPFIAQVFQKKMSQSDTETLYSLPTKQARGRDVISSTYDTFVPNQPPGLEQLIELQEKVKSGSLSMDEALERFSDWQRVQKGMDAIQQEKLRQLRASIINNREDDESVYDKINIIHHTPNVTVNECRRGSQPVETDFYSKPLKGQHVPSNKKQDP
ncbi:B-cell scaffold protein with ankyrin repeats-like [Coregonus clupeaformis]|uniref:B-cell scaffold protein with ankyrin repeats-like n=1 Tax=Coregonus clupeaformis TaxID=59861 RepID=UPI001E1C8927|nr:B-cell scaffold protein with ankyrin repeats-like [Coregonus clupeaformis]